MRPWLLLGALNGLMAVVAGAYGWHAVAVADTGLRDVFRTALDYHMWHALALLAVAWLAHGTAGWRRRAVAIAGTAFTAGIVLFSGSLYGLALTGAVIVEGAAPAGGMLLMVGWALLIAVALLPGGASGPSPESGD